jgi:hypothetical protein
MAERTLSHLQSFCEEKILNIFSAVMAHVAR